MKREIKFRALKDDMTNCHFVYGCLVYDNGVPRILEDNFLSFLFTTCLKDTEGQYTGLKDKNGKEIYEGDILRCDDGSLQEVYFHDEGAFVCRDIKTEGILRDDWAIESDDEVFGNIYENPELLK